ncbi:MAG TPA: outer membrane beta-barrel protein [Burkholderiales bacterium]|nr:outer membrane beta-barrel protein [Burkholderiales bacterium]
MRRMIFRYLPALMFAGAAMAPLGSHAADVSPIVKGGFDFGGDTVVSVDLSGSGGSSSKSVKAHQGGFVGLGASILMDSRVLEAEVSLSYKFSSIIAQNADIDWTVFPLDALVFYRLPNFRLGGGLTYHLDPTLKGRKAASSLNARYDDALGYVLQADYVLDKRFNFGVRYTSVDYKLHSQTTPSISATPLAPSTRASGFGIVFSMVGF